MNIKEKREKFTTTLTPTHINNLNKLSGLLGFRNLNDTIEFLIDKEIGGMNNGLEKKKRNKSRKNK